MPGDGGWHTRIVLWLKVALPLAALLLLSTLFLVANRIGGEADLPLSETDIADRLREPRVTRPAYSGVTSDGASLTLSAAEARPDDPQAGVTRASRMRGRLQSQTGSIADLVSDDVQVDTAQRQAVLTGNVVMDTSDGYHVETEGLTAKLDASHLETTAPVQAKGPPGTITADRMVLTEDPARPGAHVLDFTGKVKLLYLPPVPDPVP